MGPRLARSLYFGSFLVNPQIFHVTPLSFALVNIKPLLPGHVLVSPVRVAPRLSDLTPAEVADLFTTVQRVGRVIERAYKASALNVAVQDGEAAGQSVPHVHAHIIPRKPADLDDRGGPDAIYQMMDNEEGNIGKHLEERSKFPAPDPDKERKPRSEEEMEREAEWIAERMEEEI